LLLDLEGSAERRRLSSLSLGLVNDFVNEFEEDDEEENDPRQGQGDQLVSSSSKWHKHTVKVFDMLRRNMPDDDPRQMSFNAICDPDAVTRRTACGVFFELLQLKTWDYIELDQDEFYGDMKVRHWCCSKRSPLPGARVSLQLLTFPSSLRQISPGVKFNENTPAANRESMAGPSEAQAVAAAAAAASP
jgi:Conserved region of Rad21 / Rec8 like protein